MDKEMNKEKLDKLATYSTLIDELINTAVSFFAYNGIPEGADSVSFSFDNLQEAINKSKEKGGKIYSDVYLSIKDNSNKTLVEII